MWKLIAVLVLMALLGLAACGPPPAVVDAAEAFFPDVLFRVETSEPVVALTLDDGPDPEATPELLGLLAEHDARATFFLVGERLEGNEDLVRRIVEEGHELGHHMMQDEASILLGADTFAERFQAMHERLEVFGGARWFRPADGFFTPAMTEAAERRGYRLALGSVYPNDPANPFVSYLSGFILRHIGPGEVIILHSGPERGRRTARVLERVLPELRRRGYRITTLSELVSHSSPHSK